MLWEGKMFGYVKPVIENLLVKEHEFYKATYCGICRSMKAHTGALSTATITYDSVLLALVRMAFIPDEALKTRRRRCIAHPLKARPMLDDNAAIEYTVRAFAILSYYKMVDDLGDEALGKRMILGAARPVLASARKKAGTPLLEDIVREKLAAINELEAAGCPSVDEPAALFGELLGEIFSHGLDTDAALVTRTFGYYLGKFIYAADAAEDYDEDIKRGRYNPYALMYNNAPLTSENKATIKCALLLECRGIESALNLMSFGNKVTVENIVRNIVFEGLPKRLEFLDEQTK
jgi:hypothetical protein